MNHPTTRLHRLQLERNLKQCGQVNHPTKQFFTLIELLVVIAIIAILMSLLLPALSGARYRARLTRIPYKMDNNEKNFEN